MQGALAVLEAALVSNVTPLSPITKAIGQLQTAILKTPRPASARAAPTPSHTPVQLWSSLRPAREENREPAVAHVPEDAAGAEQKDDAPCCVKVTSCKPLAVFLRLSCKPLISDT